MKAAVGRGMAFQRRAGDRNERNDERIDAEADQLFGHIQDRFGVSPRPARM